MGRFIRRSLLFLLLLVVVLAVGLTIFLGPALPVVARWAALPTPSNQTTNILIAGRDVEYCKPGYGPIGLEAVPCADTKNRRSDTMIVVGLNASDKTIKILSVPRDTKVGVGFTANDKINAVLPNGGANAMTKAVEQLLGIRLAGHLIVSLKGTRELVDAMGGINILVPKAMQYQDRAAGLKIDLKPGVQWMDGKTAEGYLRFRHDNLGDIGRTQRQQSFFKAVLEQLRQPSTLQRLPKIVTAIDRNIETNLDRGIVGKLLWLLPQKPRFDTLSLPGDFANLYGVSYWQPNQNAIRGMVAEHFKGSRPIPRDVRRLSVAVMNVTNIPGLAKATRAKLWKLGYRNVWIADPVKANPKTTQVLSNLSIDEAKLVSMELGIGQPVVSSETSFGADITVRVGEDSREAIR